jgi:hypothetical protein
MCRNEDAGWRVGAAITGREKEYFLFVSLSIQIDFGTHTDTCTVGTGVVFRELK